jgi:hypothetical protein
MMPDSAMYNSGTMRYTFIEGLGSLDWPIMSAANTSYDHEARLLCFSTHGTQPLMSPRMVLFDNDSSCSYWPVDIETVSSGSSISVSPNPVSSTLTLRYPNTIPKERLNVVISNTAGQLVHAESFIPQGSKTDMVLGDQLAPGVYSIAVYGGGNAVLYKGTFLKQ